ncbi:Pilin [Piscirickettsia salmonis]|uniref:Pilus biogenesis protein tapA n=1 Tax=Piscirickettsia salmonis TaxID=1238 RepID=A0AAC8ZPX1_PISSA|nr:prepilin-type N-terminal cleavage/methylation domain-containing protein [Piscirickettsia salmonis]AKP72503.1 hypothetical protein PSLF89_336 [Piscirickettsia salmonis LF-89 = ATCC VR-1361]ALB24030.1 Pilus biogenesis protein tapA precursor [Piscirickettsia salmonis]ALY03844.1 hypothetical protein AWE47_14060 [Piscirickettsia salmonis]AMA43407.1 hypothetical protein AWJ11_14285 [Piscirickettsia salmonis]AOS35876.1 hypothetical protein AVM72_11400 [Piscirickettsia salmonis]
MNRSKNRNQLGFSLIEIMVAVAIIGILIAIAVPSYQEYVSRAKNAALDATIAAYKAPVAIAIGESGQINSDMDLSNSSMEKYHFPAPPNASNQVTLTISPNQTKQTITIEAEDDSTGKSRQTIGTFANNTLTWGDFQNG